MAISSDYKWAESAGQTSTELADVEGVPYAGTTVYLVADNLRNAQRMRPSATPPWRTCWARR